MKASHGHLISCCLSEIERQKKRPVSESPVRILDAGCGKGRLIADLMVELEGTEGLENVELYGFEVLEHGACHHSYLPEVLAALSGRLPGVDWKRRIRVVSTDDPWPFDDDSFDLVVSNQVIEHVADLGWFFEQMRRVLRPNGISIHHFPTAESLADPHSGVPFAHWPESDFRKASVIRLFSQLGCGKFRHYRRERGHSLDDFVDEFVDYLKRYTHFRSFADVARVAKRTGLAVSARYNWALFQRWLSGDAIVYPYSTRFGDSLFTRALLRVASGTIVCQKLERELY